MATTSPWRALPVALVAALVPKCPLCLAAWLSAAGFAGAGTLVSGAALSIVCAVGLVATVAWFTWRRGWAGGVVAGLFAASVASARLVPGARVLGLVGVALLALYLGGDRFWRARRTAPERTAWPTTC